MLAARRHVASKFTNTYFTIPASKRTQQERVATMNELMEFFGEPFQYPFCNYCRGYHWYRLRYFILLYGVKGWSLMGDAAFYAVLPGVVLAYVCNSFNDRAFLFGPICSFCNRLFKRA